MALYVAAVAERPLTYDDFEIAAGFNPAYHNKRFYGRLDMLTLEVDGIHGALYQQKDLYLENSDLAFAIIFNWDEEDHEPFDAKQHLHAKAISEILSHWLEIGAPQAVQDFTMMSGNYLIMLYWVHTERLAELFAQSAREQIKPV